jgi:hypothetical protein
MEGLQVSDNMSGNSHDLPLVSIGISVFFHKRFDHLLVDDITGMIFVTVWVSGAYSILWAGSMDDYWAADTLLLWLRVDHGCIDKTGLQKYMACTLLLDLSLFLHFSMDGTRSN